MPHLTIQATSNVVINNPKKLLQDLNQLLWDSGEFKQPSDIKARILVLNEFLIGTNDNEKNSFVYAQFKLMPGRSVEVREALADKILNHLKQALKPQQDDQVSVQFGVEVLELSTIYKKSK